MGLQSGEPQPGGPAGYVEIDVRRAAWIAAAGHGGQALLSAAIGEMVKHDLPDGMTLLDLGERRLKETQRSERIFQLVCAGLPAEFPPLRTLELTFRTPKCAVFAIFSDPDKPRLFLA
jgi:hypothetical protein